MKANNNLPKMSYLLNLRLNEARAFAEEFGIHLLLEVSLVGIINSFLQNTFLSTLLGVSIVEGCQWICRKWGNRY
jgi:hypothetical protein